MRMVYMLCACANYGGEAVLGIDGEIPTCVAYTKQTKFSTRRQVCHSTLFTATSLIWTLKQLGKNEESIFVDLSAQILTDINFVVLNIGHYLLW